MIKHPLYLLLHISLAFVPGLSWADNALQGHASPYLARHGDDPVNWQDWSPEVLARAKAENKILFVSIGYFSCHWCHVMQRESFRNTAIAELLNEHFIPVKVDRELHPALDSYLLDFVQRTRGMAGWPLNVFLTPEGHPLVGMVYVPPDRLQALLQDLQQQWLQGGDYLRQVAKQAAQAMQGTQAGEEALPKLTREAARQARAVLVQQALQLGDDMDGGFGEQTKFPMAPQLLALLSAYEQTQDPALKALLVITLERMAGQGLRDHLGGGFFRYATDPGWQIPHFEKMLYDNALLARLYLRAAKALDEPGYAAVAHDTLRFMVREMLSPQAAMVASFSAVDDAGVEGGYYLWRKDELQALLSAEERQVVHALWGMQGSAEWEAGHLMRQRAQPAEAAKELKLTESQLAQTWRTAQAKLLRARAQRKLPVDGKMLAAWNGLALSALVAGLRDESASQADRENYEAAARQVRDYLLKELWDGKRLLRAVDTRPKGDKVALGQAGIDDYAFVAEGLWAWAQWHHSDQDRAQVQVLVREAWRRFHDDTGWRLSDQTLLPTGYGVPLLAEGPLPSAAASLQRLSLQILRSDVKSAADRELMGQKLERSLAAGLESLRQQAFDFPTHVQVLLEQEDE